MGGTTIDSVLRAASAVKMKVKNKAKNAINQRSSGVHKGPVS